jgi:hypothetical protein
MAKIVDHIHPKTALFVNLKKKEVIKHLKYPQKPA